MPRYIDAEPFDNMCMLVVFANERPVDAVFRMIHEAPTADVVSKEKYDELNERYHRLLESANILKDAVRDYERRKDDEIH